MEEISINDEIGGQVIKHDQMCGKPWDGWIEGFLREEKL